MNYIYIYFLQNINFLFNFFFLQNINFLFNFFYINKLFNFKKSNLIFNINKPLLNYKNNLNYSLIFSKNINKYVISYFYNFVFFKINFKNHYFLNNSFLIVYKYFFNLLYTLINSKQNIYIFDLNFKNMYYLYSYIYSKNFVKVYQNFFFFNINKIFRKNFYFFFRSFFNNNNISMLVFLDYKFALKNIVEFSKFNVPILNFSSHFYNYKSTDLVFFNFNYNYIYLFNWFLLNKIFFISINNLILTHKVYFFKNFDKYLKLL